MSAWDATSVIITKRDGGELTPEAIGWFIDAYTRGEVADEQAAALLMAIYFQGMVRDELAAWTNAMIETGRRIDLSHLTKPTVDKHSTGGVGDKISLILGPVVAACGVAMPQVSGRGLGHTGGTLDKMASIPGWVAHLTPEQLTAAMTDVGAVITAAGDDLAPADAKLYSLRDVTATVASIPLIASSIMSKKIASGTSSLVLDVKVGRGAFMTELDDARRLAETMVEIGQASGVATVALLTRMDSPLGRAVGNTIEVDEAVSVLNGGGPSDVKQITVALACEMLKMVGNTSDPEATLVDGTAAAAWDSMVRAQGGDPDGERPRAANTQTVDATRSGWIADLDALSVGVAAMRLGAGRARKEDDVDHGAGIEILAKPGEPVDKGQPVLRLHTNDPSLFASARELLEPSITIGSDQVEIPSVILERIA